MRNGVAPSEAITSATSSAGWPLASIARRTAAISLVTPLAVSVCTANTATMRRSVSARSAASTRAGSSACPGRAGVRSASTPSASACTAQASAKWPLPATSTRAPGAARLTMVASQAPWPLAAYINTSAWPVPSSRARPRSQSAISVARRGSDRSMHWRAIASRTASGTCVGPGVCRNCGPARKPRSVVRLSFMWVSPGPVPAAVARRSRRVGYRWAPWAARTGRRCVRTPPRTAGPAARRRTAP